jgi:hypothetical protein
MPDMQKQVDAVREAFSADVRKPFVLKPTFPYGSPHSTNQSTPSPLQTAAKTESIDRHFDVPQMPFVNYPVSPPVSTGPIDTRNNSPGVQSLSMMAAGQGNPPQAMPQRMPVAEAPIWNPARIFE